MPENYHIPVLSEEAIATLLRNDKGIYIDGTLGGGGHAELFLNMLSNEAVYIAIDRDKDAIEYAKNRLNKFDNVHFYHGTFNHFDKVLNIMNVQMVDSIFLDLGLSGWQIGDNARGFAFRPGLKLDMRMSQDDNKTAADILNEYDEDKLTYLFKEHGEERFSKNIARKIVKNRLEKPITVSDQLMEIIDRCVPGKFLVKSYARIFQALRIELNNELEILRETLEKSLKYLKSGGRIGVISYHSGEDRIVKSFFQAQENPCKCPPDIPYCVCGLEKRMIRIKPYLIMPSESEIKNNPRARSAKFRVGEKL